MSTFASDLFRGRVALVTGGGTGIGYACAERFAACGGRVAIASRSMAHLEPAAERLREGGAECLAATCDIREAEQTEALVRRVLAEWGRLDVLVNNAGGQFPLAAEAITPGGWDSVIRTNLGGTFLMTRAAATLALIPGGGGAIVNVIADIARGFPGMAHTGAARAGVENLTRTLAVEWARHKIRVNAVAPGVIRTEGVAQYGEALLEGRRREIPFKRLGTAAEAADPIVFLASPAASYVSGATLYVDGAAHLWGRTWPIPEA